MGDSSCSWELSSESEEELDVEEGTRPCAPLTSSVMPSITSLAPSKSIDPAVCLVQTAIRRFFAREQLALRAKNQAQLRRAVANVTRSTQLKAWRGLQAWQAAQQQERRVLFEQFLGHCAVMIQKTFRGFRTRKAVLKRKTLLLAVYLGWRTRRALKSEAMQALQTAIRNAQPEDLLALKREFNAAFVHFESTGKLPRPKRLRQPLQRDRTMHKGHMLLEQIKSSHSLIPQELPRSANLLAPNHSLRRRMNNGTKSPTNHGEIKQKTMKLLALISNNHKPEPDSSVFCRLEKLMRCPKTEDKLLFVRGPRVRLNFKTVKRQLNTVDKLEAQLRKDLQTKPDACETYAGVLPRLGGRVSPSWTVDQLKAEYYRLTNVRVR